MDRFECERCGTTRTAYVFYGMPSAETLGYIKDRKDVVIGGRVRRPGNPDLACIVCHWPVENEWTAFDGPISGWDSYQRPLDQALAEYDEEGGSIDLLALSFDGYSAFGGMDEVHELIKGVEKRWESNGKLPTNLGRLRTCLFREQRDSHHSGSTLLRPYTEALVSAIRKAASAAMPSHARCFVCGPRGLGIDLVALGVGGGVALARFTIDKKWADGAGVIPQGLVAAIFDECFTRAAWERSHRSMRVWTVNSSFQQPMNPGREYEAACEASGGPGESLEVRVRILGTDGEEVARATATMADGPLPAFVFLPTGDDSGAAGLRPW